MQTCRNWILFAYLILSLLLWFQVLSWFFSGLLMSRWTKCSGAVINMRISVMFSPTTSYFKSSFICIFSYIWCLSQECHRGTGSIFSKGKEIFLDCPWELGMVLCVLEFNCLNSLTENNCVVTKITQVEKYHVSKGFVKECSMEHELFHESRGLWPRPSCYAFFLEVPNPYWHNEEFD